MIVNGEVESLSTKVLSLEDKLVHKDWKSRLDAYEDLLNKFDDPAQCSKYGAFLKSILSETNVVALEKGVAAGQKYVENAPASSLAKHADDITQCIISKCFTSAKQSLRQASGEVLLSMIEAEQTPLVMAGLLAAMDGKSPKSAAACINITTQALSLFGPQVISLKPLLKKIAALFENRDKSVRDEAKLLTVEMFRWIGKDALQPYLESLKPVQVADLQSAFDALQAGGDNNPPRPKRFIKSVQMQRHRAAEANEPQATEAANYAGTSSDALDLFDAVDIVSTLPKDFYTKIRSTKWQDRLDALETLGKAAEKSKKLEPKVDYSAIMGCLKVIIQKDSNINVVTQALVALKSLATGLQNHFSNPSSFVLIVLEKFREKKGFVLETVRAAADALLPTISTFDAVVELVLPFFSHKTPSVKYESLQMMARYISHRPPTRTTTKKTIGTLCKAGISCTNDPDPLVRDGAFRMLGHLMKAYGENNAPLSVLFADLDKTKAGKIREYADKADIAQNKLTASQQPFPNDKSVPAPSSAVKKIAAPVVGTSRAPSQTRKPAAGADAARSDSESVSGSTTTPSASRPHQRGRNAGAPQQARNVAAPVRQQAASNNAISAGKSRVGRPPAAVHHQSENADISNDEDDDESFAAAANTSASVSMPLFVNAKDTKKKRAYEERYVRQFDWCNDAVSAFSTKQMQYLAQKFKQCCHPSLHSALFMDDESCWLTAIDMLIKQAKIPSKAAALAENSDLLFKWCGARLRSDHEPCSPELFSRIMSLVQAVVDALLKQQPQQQGRMSEDDAYSLIPAILRQTATPPNSEIMSNEQLSAFLTTRLCLVIDYAALFSLLVHTAAAGMPNSSGVVSGEQPFAVRRRALQLALLLCSQFGATVCGCVSAREQETLTCMARLALSAGSDQRSIEIRAIAVEMCEKFFQTLVNACGGNEQQAADMLTAALNRLAMQERSQFVLRLRQHRNNVLPTIANGVSAGSITSLDSKSAADDADKSRPATFKIVNPTPSLERPLVTGISAPVAPGAATKPNAAAVARSAAGTELNAANNIDNDPITELNDALSYVFTNNKNNDDSNNAENATKSLSDALKAVHEMATTMHHPLAGGNSSTSTNAAYSQYFLLKSQELIHALCGVMQTVHMSCLNDAARNSNIIQKLLLRSNETLGIMLDRPAWTASVTYHSASQLIEAQLDLLTDDRLKQTVERGDALVKQLNGLVLRMVDALRIPHIIVAGFSTMYALLAQAAPQTKVDLALRIIWRSVKNLDAVAAAEQSKNPVPKLGTATATIEWPQSLTVELFVQLNAILVRFPQGYWAKLPEEEQGPLRAVRIIVARLARLQGFRLIQALDALDGSGEDDRLPRSGELYSLVSKCLEQNNNNLLLQQQQQQQHQQILTGSAATASS